MKNFMKQFKLYLSKNHFSYAKYYRRMGELLREYEENSEKKQLLKKEMIILKKTKPIIPNKINKFVMNNVFSLKNDFVDILTYENSADLLWILNEIKIKDNQTILCRISPSLSKISEVKRGGINVYKMNGWIIHVLFVYQILHNNIISGNTPDTIVWAEEIRQLFKKELRFRYTKIGEVGKFALKIGSLCHDLGVIDGVQNHHISGLKYVSSFFEEINLTESKLNELGFNFNLHTFREIVSYIVKYHSFINMVSGEYSDVRVKDELQLIRKSAAGNKILLDFLENDFSNCILLLGISDVIAVDDYLLTYKKIQKMIDSCKYIQNIMRGNEIKRRKKNVAISRLQEMVKEVYHDEITITKSLDNVLNHFKLSYEEFCRILYFINTFEYSVGILKPMDDPECTIKALCLCFLIVKNFFGTKEKTLTKIKIIFNSEINITLMKKRLSHISYKDVKDLIINKKNEVNVKGIVFIINEPNRTISITLKAKK